MPKKGVGWPTVGQTSHDLGEHSKLLLDEARQLVDFGSPAGDGSLGKQCPYHTLNAFCTSLIAYLENSMESLSSGKEDIEPYAVHEGPIETPLKTISAKKPQYESPFPSKVFRQISQPLTPQKNHQEPKTTPSSERLQPCNIDTFGILVLYVPSNFDVNNQKRAIDGIVSVNKGFIPGISVKSIEWLIPEWTKTKHHSNLLVEFDHPQHANAAIREQLLVGTKVLGCEYYERDSRLRQCFFCQQYRHFEAQCQAAKPVCGRCAGRHVTADCKAREDAQNFRCAICGGTHRAWDNVCRARQEELDCVRSARANAPRYHAVNGQVPQDGEMAYGDVPSREFAGTRHYSIDFLVELNLRGGRKSHGRNKGKGGRQSGLLGMFDEDAAINGPETPYSARAKAGQPAQTAILTPQSAGTPSEADRYNTWIRSRLLTMGIEPYTPGAPKPDHDREDVRGTPATPTPADRPSDVWDRFAQVDTPSKMSERMRKSLGSATNQAEKSLSEKAANVAKIRGSSSWR